MPSSGKPNSELVRTKLFDLYSVKEVKAWREAQHRAGKPSELQDFFEAHGLCFVCKATGVDPHPVACDGAFPLFAPCKPCKGTGKTRVSKSEP